MLADLIASAGVQEVHQEGGPVGVMAIHGGLEEGTDRMARQVAAATGAALYAVVQPKDLWWHVPSIRYDPKDSAALASFINSVDVAVSLHGFGQPDLEHVALLGGNNRRLAGSIRRELAARGIESLDDLEAIPKRLRGTHQRNPVNLPRLAGVQVELPMSLREGDKIDLVTEALSVAISAQVGELPHRFPAS